jgi:hypothetical protein
MSGEMRKGERKLFLFGRYSLALLLPKRWLTELGVNAGAMAQLEFDRARKRIVVRFTTSPLSKTGRSTRKDQSPSDDLEPIPQL